MTRDPARAHLAYNKISAVHEDIRKEYGGNCLRLPAMIHQNGLCQTLAFLEAKSAKNPVFGRLLNDLAAVSGLAQTGAEFAAATRSADLATYQRYTRDALASATYLKRYAEAVLRVEDADVKR